MWNWLSTTLCCLLILGACAPTEQAPTAAVRSLETSTQVGGGAEWQETLEAARQEGKLVISGPARELWRKVLVTFQEEFPAIELEYTGSNSRDFWPRVFRERELSQYLWDLRVGGPDPNVYIAKERGVLAPLRPVLFLPEIVDETKWFGGFDGMFFDEESKYVLGFVNYVSIMAHVNRDLIPEPDLGSIKELTDPRWKGKIAIQDPRGGAGLSSLQMLLALYGEDYVVEFLTKQDLVLTGDIRQLAEWVIRGRYPIGVGLVPDAFLIFQDQGLGLNIQPIQDSGRAISTGTGGIQLLSRSPHPNAAKIYINWLLTKSVQARLSASTRQNSRRLDVPIAYPLVSPDLERLEEYIPSQREQFLPLRQRALELAMEHLR